MNALRRQFVSLKAAIKGRVLQLFFITQNYLLKLGVYVRYINSLPRKEIELISGFLRCANDISLVERVGPLQSDGGYYLPKHLQAKYCISPGVGPISAFELDLEKRYLIPSLLLDASVTKPKEELSISKFLPKFLGVKDTKTTISLETAIEIAEQNFGQSNNNILQIDIEGDELLIFLKSYEKIFEKFQVVVLEVHFIDLIVFPHISKLLLQLLAVLDEDYMLIWSDVNQCCGTFTVAGHCLPRVVELSYVRKSQ